MDQPAIIDGWTDQSSGQDASRSADVIAKTAFALGVNITCRDGMPQTRPQFRRLEIPPSPAYRGGFFQGCESYYNPATGVSCLLAVIDGRIYRINPDSLDFEDLSEGGLVNDSLAQHYFCQVDSFMVIQSGRDGALIFDGANLRRANDDEAPIGSIMAFGQGRLFVASPDKRSFIAGDLVYGGSTTEKAIQASAAVAGAAKTKVTTVEDHGFTTDDVVTIMGHSSNPSIVGTWTITVTGARAFTIPTTITSGGSGGTASRANDGQESDALRFTEYRFLNEKGIFRLPVWMGPITAMLFFPIQDTGTGQGDLIVAGKNGACSFQVSAPRETWLNIAMQRVLLTDIGFESHLGKAQVNGDIFFDAADGLRSIRNARAEFGSYGNTPLSAEMGDQITRPMRVGNSSMALADNRLLYTSHPRPLLDTETAFTPARVIFQSLTALDFQKSSRISKDGLAAFDGYWTGLDCQQLVQTNGPTGKRLFAWCWQLTEQEGGDPRRTNQLWEITTRYTGFDRHVSCEGEVQREPIGVQLDLRAFDFGQWMLEKRLTRMDLWLSNIRGGISDLAANVAIYWRPDILSAGWFFWANAVFQPDGCAYICDTGTCNEQPQIRPAFSVSPFRIGKPPDYVARQTNRPADIGFTFQVRITWRGPMQIKKGIVHSVQMVDPTQGDITARATTDTSDCASSPILMPFIGGPYGYTITASEQCELVPCVSLIDLPTSGPLEFDSLFIAGDGYSELQVFAGARLMGRLGDAGTYNLQFANGMTTADITMIANGLTIQVILTPDAIGQPDIHYAKTITPDACFDQPLEVTLDTGFVPL